MTLFVETYKTRKTDCSPVYKRYIYACFDRMENGEEFQDQFNHAFKTLKREIQEDRERNDMNIYNPIVIANVWIN